MSIFWTPQPVRAPTFVSCWSTFADNPKSWSTSTKTSSTPSKWRYCRTTWLIWNIEATYAAITGQYEEFPNLCFVDTLDNVGLHTSAKGTTAGLFAGVSEENVVRIKRQNSKKISVIIGNPPYNANQANENDNNKKTANIPKLIDTLSRHILHRAQRKKQNFMTCMHGFSGGLVIG